MRNFARFTRNNGTIGYGVVDSDRPGEAANFGSSFELIAQHSLNDDTLYWTDASDIVLLDSTGAELMAYAAVDRDYDGGDRYGIRRGSDGAIVGYRTAELRDAALEDLQAGGTPGRTWSQNTLEYWDMVWPDTAPEAPAATLDEVWAALGAQANERGWCAEYDAFAAKLGGPARPARQRRYTVYARVPVEVTIDEHPDGANAAVAAWYANSPREARNAVSAALREAITGGYISAPRVLDLTQEHAVL